VKHIPALLAILTLTTSVRAQECAQGSTCVPKKDMDTFVELLKEKKCLQTEKPTFTLDPITVVTDEKGRVFYTGNDPAHPYKLKMSWCSFEAEGTGKVDVVAAMQVPSTWGFRFRPKAYLGYLPLQPVVYSKTANEGIDAGLMLDFFHVQYGNLNAAVGIRSFGLGLGVDVTGNFGLYAGYAMSWKDWNHNLNTAFWFAF
jgi:hypothetical protein